MLFHNKIYWIFFNPNNFHTLFHNTTYPNEQIMLTIPTLLTPKNVLKYFNKFKQLMAFV